MLKIPQCLDSRLTDGGKVVSLTRRPRSTGNVTITIMYNILRPEHSVSDTGACISDGLVSWTQ
jgi:hypothetical protein